MADETRTGSVEMKRTLGLTGLTMNAMALIAPGAFLWLTFYIQATTGTTAPAMWVGIVLALLLCLATAVCYAEMAKLYPGTGSSYYFAEQSFLNHDKAWRYARLSKFIVGWGSHLYYWIYPGVMVGVMGILCGYLVGTIWPNFMSASNPGPAFMMVVAIVFSFVIAYIGYKGVNGSTAVNIAHQCHPDFGADGVCGAGSWLPRESSGGQPGFAIRLDLWSLVQLRVRDHAGQGRRWHSRRIPSSATPTRYHSRSWMRRASQFPSSSPIPTTDDKGNFLTHTDAGSVVSPHKMSWMFLQATVAILILVGFESVTAMGGEAKNAKRDVPIAVIVSLLVQGVFCYLFEYFAANYFLNSGYTMQSAAGSAAPIGDMMMIVGDSLFGAGGGRIFMLVEAFTVFLALIGTTLSCMNTGARVTYAMGKDREVPEHFGLLHGDNLTPHRAIWTLAVISAVVGCIAVVMPFGDAGAPADSVIAAIPHGFWSSFGYTTNAKMAALPNSLLTVTLASNFGTFLLYGLSCVTCMVAYHKHPKFNALRHFLIPLFGVVANLACMVTYLVGPFLGIGTKAEPLLALGIALVWAIYGGIYFVTSTRATGRTTLLNRRTA